jgi:hypothetical protein
MLLKGQLSLINYLGRDGNCEGIMLLIKEKKYIHHDLLYIFLKTPTSRGIMNSLINALSYFPP